MAGLMLHFLKGLNPTLIRAETIIDVYCINSINPIELEEKVNLK